jgi:hypothetical protein
VARSHEGLWLAASAAFTAVAVALLGVNATFDVGRPHYTFWSSGLMVIVYVAGVLAIVCFAGAMRSGRSRCLVTDRIEERWLIRWRVPFSSLSRTWHQRAWRRLRPVR